MGTPIVLENTLLARSKSGVALLTSIAVSRVRSCPKSAGIY